MIGDKVKLLFESPSNVTRKFTFIFFDLIAFTAALTIAYEIRFESQNPYLFNNTFLIPLLAFIIVKFIVFYSFRLYDISWRYVSLQDLANIGKACLTSTGILFVLIYGFNISAFNGFPRSVVWIDFILSFMFSAGFKISKRMYLEVMRQSIGNSVLKRTLIVGAGSSSEQLLRDINRSVIRTLYPIGFIDDDPAKQNLYLQGVRVLGSTENLEEIIKNYRIDSILISVLSADRKFHRKIFEIARRSGVSDVKVVSTINDISDTIKVGAKDIRDINMSDLIGRQAVSINTKIIGGFLANKNVLITGAAGSIGSEIARQVISYNPVKIGILDVNESDLADLENQIARKYKQGDINSFLCDISNSHKVDKIFDEFRPDVVFHAAAFKHVPVMEKFPEEAVRVNIVGTNNLASAARKYNVESFVLISTDKAVNPSSIMGASKRIAEQIVTGAGKSSNSNFVAVRFGNVIGSRGSVLPVFLEQLNNGGPLTITHPEMKRFFMTIPEAVALVLQAAATGSNGDVFVLDMGEPIKIVDLARDLILLNNLIPDKDVEIKYTGMREGEKLFEEVLTAEEGVIATSHEKIFKARMISYHNSDSVSSMVEEFKNMKENASKRDWIAILKYYVPTFQHSNVMDFYDTEVNSYDDPVLIQAESNKK